MWEKHDLPVSHRHVETVSITREGKRISDEKELEPFKDKFSWVNRSAITALVLDLRRKTDSDKKSVIAIHENGTVTPYVNVGKDFLP